MSPGARERSRPIVELLAAVATTERVARALHAYPERDAAVEALEDDVRIAHELLVEDVRARLRPHTRAALSAADHVFEEWGYPGPPRVRRVARPLDRAA